MEQSKIFVPGNLNGSAERIPVPVYFENGRWRLASNAVGIGAQVVGFIVLAAVLAILGAPLRFPPTFLIHFLLMVLPALAMAVIFANGSLDLSMGAVTGLVSVVAAQGVSSGAPPFAALFGGMLVALLFGAINAAAVGLARIPGFIVTVVVAFAVRALILLTTNGDTFLYHERSDAIPILAAVFGLLLAGGIFVWTQWPGVNARLARREGRAIGGFRLALPFLVSALTAGVTGLLLMWYTGAGYAEAARNQELQSLVVVALAGTCLYGRYVNVIGVLTGAFLFSLLEDFLTQMNLQAAVHYIVMAVILVLAVGFTYLHHSIVGLLYRASSRKKGTADGTDEDR